MTSQRLYLRSQHKVSFEVEYEQLPASANASKLINKAATIVELNSSQLTATLSSPNYPEPYPNAANFVWLIKTEAASHFHFEITDADMEACCDEMTVFDGVDDGGRVLAFVTGQNHLNTSSMRTVVSSSNVMMIRFQSDCTVRGRGFSGIVRAVEDHATTPQSTAQPPVATEATTWPHTTPVPNSDQNITTAIPTNDQQTTTTPPVTEPSGFFECDDVRHLTAQANATTLLSPNYPGEYPEKACIEWLIETASPRDHVVSLLVNDLVVELKDDFVYMQDGTNGLTLATLNCQNLPWACTGHTVRSIGPSMIVRLTSDRSKSQRGFNFTYTEVEATSNGSSSVRQLFFNDHVDIQQTCIGGLFDIKPLTTYDGKMSTPGFREDLDYPNGTDCEWLIKTNGHLGYDRVGAKLYGLETLEDGVDYVNMYDGPEKDALLLNRYTGDYGKATREVFATGDTMRVVFHSSVHVSYKGFYLYYKMTY